MRDYADAEQADTEQPDVQSRDARDAGDAEQLPDVDRAEEELAVAENRDDPQNRVEVERAEADLAAAEEYGDPDAEPAERAEVDEAGHGRHADVGMAPVAPEPVSATAIPLEATGVAVGTYEGPTAAVPVEGVPVEGVPVDERRDTEPVDERVDEPGGQLRPGEAQAVPAGAVWDDGTRQDLRDRWREVQLRFVDDPSGTVDEAQALVDEAVDRYTAVLRDRRQELDSWRSGAGQDTEVLRAALRG
jgi:hypothetical protein